MNTTSVQVTVEACHPVERACLDLFVATGQAHTAAEVATAAGTTTNTARRLLDCSPAIGSAVEHRTSYSRDYPGMEAGTHRVRVYRPTNARLAEEIRTLRAANANGGSR